MYVLNFVFFYETRFLKNHQIKRCNGYSHIAEIKKSWSICMVEAELQKYCGIFHICAQTYMNGPNLHKPKQSQRIYDLFYTGGYIVTYTYIRYSLFVSLFYRIPHILWKCLKAIEKCKILGYMIL